METEYLFRVIFFVLFAAVLIVRGYFGWLQRHTGASSWDVSPEAVEREGRGSLVLRLLLFLGMLTVFALYAVNPPWLATFSIPLPDWVRWLGAGLGVVGLILLVWVHQTLGRHWSTNLELRDEHQLVTSGPYRWIRHPMYTALFTFFIGMALLSASWLIVSLVVVSVLGLYARINKEEAMLIQQFGGAYRDYMANTGRLLPPFTRVWLTVLIIVGIQGALLFISAGRLDWPLAWVYLGVFALGSISIGTYLWINNPALLQERSEYKPRKGVQTWDSVFSVIVRLSFFALLIVSGLDQRFGWTDLLPWALQLLALAVALQAYALIAWVLVSNRNAAVYARVQSEHGHTVTRRGPYRIVRHPFYVGVVGLALCVPLVLGSLWAMIPGVVMAVAIIIKAALEDRLLIEELDGYRDYADQVRYRLLPRVW